MDVFSDRALAFLHKMNNLAKISVLLLLPHSVSLWSQTVRYGPDSYIPDIFSMYDTSHTKPSFNPFQPNIMLEINYVKWISSLPMCLSINAVIILNGTKQDQIWYEGRRKKESKKNSISCDLSIFLKNLYCLRTNLCNTNLVCAIQ